MLERYGKATFDYDLHGEPGNGTTTGETASHETALTRIQWHFFDESRLPVAVQTWKLPVGGREGMHRHPEHDPLDELYLVIEGSARMRVDERVHDLGPGDAVLAPVGADHDLHNTGDATLTIVVVWGNRRRPTGPATARDKQPCGREAGKHRSPNGNVLLAESRPFTDIVARQRHLRVVGSPESRTQPKPLCPYRTGS